MIYNALSIAGSDPSGGAGIQADLKVFSAHNIYGMAAITALTAQNTTGVSAIKTLSADFVAEQIKVVFADIRVDAVKIGMIANTEIAEAVASTLDEVQAKNIVLDPVMFAKGGAPLLAEEAMGCMRDVLVPLADILTPNLPEAAALLGGPEARNREDMLCQAKALLRLGAGNIYLKGGHFTSDESPDLLLTSTSEHWLESKRIYTKNTHGTGCSLSASIAANKAGGVSEIDAAKAAKRYITKAIAGANRLQVGNGHGPICHFQ
jgi:hydroxymethylpyrimidine/phosphomethylpyrimidine kinase